MREHVFNERHENGSFTHRLHSYLGKPISKLIECYRKSSGLLRVTVNEESNKNVNKQPLHHGQPGWGQGRGRGQLTFNMEAVGIGKGDTLPPPTLQPSPLFPPLEFHPVPLTAGEKGEYVLALKQELHGTMRQLPYFIHPAVPKRDVERYSDKYQISGPIDNAIDWNPDWRRLPSELKIRVWKVQKERTTIILSKRPHKSTDDKEETIQKLETLEKKEEEVTSEEDEEKEEEEEKEEGEEEEYDEEEHEETDYIVSYFDNGEDFGGDSDDNMDEVIY
ncbi:DNA-directed RNA polymerase III subunit RPC7-like [Mastomys coucha]|uniref:DNA-directed RNA polymerase III subunit RPC7-like n=1 Tax=Mastomys coucha TaxID=35658 RepID=UPI001261F30E|nr:DNA-directed RNA polymerase III subunit RPC7-like [Mastomys coucha]